MRNSTTPSKSPASGGIELAAHGGEHGVEHHAPLGAVLEPAELLVAAARHEARAGGLHSLACGHDIRCSIASMGSENSISASSPATILP